MIVNGRQLLILMTLSVAWTAVSGADIDQQDTIKSLENKTYKVRPGKLIVDSTEKARDNYRAFLDLVSDDRLLRAEALRRLGDLQLEETEALQLAENIDSLGLTDYDSAVSLFHELL